MAVFDINANAHKVYLELQSTINEMYEKSDEYPIFKKSSKEVLLYETEQYLQEIFNNITSKDKIKNEEIEFMEKLKTIQIQPESKLNGDKTIESVSTLVPEYIKLAKLVDNYTQNTKYAMELVRYTEELCRLFQSADGVISKEETDFANPVMEKLKSFIRE